MCVLFRSAVETELAAGTLAEVRPAEASLSVDIYAVRRKAKVLSAVQEDLLGAIRERVAA